MFMPAFCALLSALFNSELLANKDHEPVPSFPLAGGRGLQEPQKTLPL
jgi:hypothetical protein